MSLAIRFGDDGNPDTPQGIIYIDATTEYGSAFKGSLTSHAIGSGGKISDHFIRDNATYSFTGVISAADISISKTYLTDEKDQYPDNVDQIDLPAVRIKDNGNNLISLLPDTVASYFVDAIPVAQFAETTRRTTLRQIRNLLEGLFSKDGMSFVTLLEYRGKVLDKSSVVSNLVMTSLSFREDSETGDALYINVTLEKPTITSLMSSRISKNDLKKFNPSKVASEVKPAAADKENKGDNPTKPTKISGAHAMFYDDKVTEEVNKMNAATEAAKNTKVEEVVP